MNNKQENTVVGNLDELEHSEKTTAPSSNKWNWLIFLVCICISFGVWFYVNFLDNTIVSNVYLVKFVLTDAGESDYISPIYGSLRFYGEESAFENIKVPITIEISKSKFITDGEVSYNTPITIKIDCPEGLHTHDDENLKFTLLQKNEKTSDNDTPTDK